MLANSQAFRLTLLTGLFVAVAIEQTSGQAPERGAPAPPTGLSRLDANRDGILQPEEIPQPARPILRRLAERAGLDPNEPLPLDRLGGRGEAGDRRDSDPDRQRDRGRSRDQERGRGDRDDDDERRRWNRDGDDNDRPRQMPAALPARVPGFGIGVPFAKVPGFDVPHSVTSQGGPTVSELAGMYDGRLIEFARRMLQRADENENQIVDPSEWDRLRWRGDLNEVDLNRDGRLTLAEIIQGIAKERKIEPKGRPSKDTSSRDDQRRESDKKLAKPNDAGASHAKDAASTTDQANQADDRRGRESGKLVEEATGEQNPDQRAQMAEARRAARRARLEQNRGGDRAPGWFRSRDRDGDGQVTMAEYASQWNDRTVAEFVARDANGDGVITLREAAQ